VVHGLCRALAARGHRVEVLTTNVDGPHNSVVPLGTSVERDGVHIRYFPSERLRRLYWSPLLGDVLREETKCFAVVHLHSVFLWPTWVAARSARKARVPYLISPHGMLVKELVERRNRLVKSMWIQLIEKRNLQNAAAIHVTSELEGEELRRFVGWQLARIEAIPYGVDELGAIGGEISPDVKELAAEQPLILYLGRISWKKGLDRLLNAFARTNGGTLAIVGPDDERLMPRLIRLVQQLQIGDRVRFLSRLVLDADKEYLYSSARLCVLPSYSENFGNTVLEAMQRGVPVLVTPDVGAAKIVQEAGGGIVASGDPQSLSAAMVRLIDDPSLARSMGEAGKRHVVEHYDWSRIAACMEDLYESIRTSASRPRGSDPSAVRSKAALFDAKH
jgi:glycosyltransferase involved in cell wall biosynthesis